MRKRVTMGDQQIISSSEKPSYVPAGPHPYRVKDCGGDPLKHFLPSSNNGQWSISGQIREQSKIERRGSIPSQFQNEMVLS